MYIDAGFYHIKLIHGLKIKVYHNKKDSDQSPQQGLRISGQKDKKVNLKRASFPLKYDKKVPFEVFEALMMSSTVVCS